jgi:ribosomal protein L11 methyltransferase
MNHFVFLVKEESSSEDAIEELSSLLDSIYEVIDPQTSQIQVCGYSEKIPVLERLTHCTFVESSPVEEIDWEKQWADFAPQFQDGIARIDLDGPVLMLKSGAGFGDMSHPTTRLVLQLMPPLMKDKVIFDIGCGSGILSIAALLLGSKKAYGIDIEESALAHSEENARVNGVEGKAVFARSIQAKWVPKEPCVILINMIEWEQKTAWEASKALHRAKGVVIASGVLSIHRSRYLETTRQLGWKLKEEKEEEGWCGFVFEKI